MEIPRPCVSIQSFSERDRRMKHTVSLKQNHEFRRLYNKGKSVAGPYLVLYCRKTNRPVSRLGLTTGVKLGKAVQRNRVRRRLREIYRTHEAEFSCGWDIVAVARVKAVYARYSQMETCFLELADRLGLRTREGVTP